MAETTFGIDPVRILLGKWKADSGAPFGRRRLAGSPTFPSSSFRIANWRRTGARWGGSAKVRR